MTSQENKRMPKVSVVIGTYNREEFLPTTLKCLASQTADYSLYEILIVDNNSSDSTREIAEAFMADYPKVDTKYLLETNQGHTFARNRGIVESKGEIISFIDDDAFVGEDYIENIIRFFKRYINAVVLGGRIVPKYESSEPKWMSRYLLPLVAALDMGNGIKKFSGSKFPIGANMAFRKEVFDQYGVFDTSLGRRGTNLEGGDEKELIERIKLKNKGIYYVPDVKVDHIIPNRRLDMEYIKGLAVGVGTSERRRMGKEGINFRIKKIFSESIKIAGTFVLFLLYSIRLQPEKAIVLLKFRWWVIIGLFQRQNINQP